eukprot:IDg3777t1
MTISTPRLRAPTLRKLNDIKTKRDDLVKKIEEVKKRLGTTNSLMGEDTSFPHPRSENVRLPNFHHSVGTKKEQSRMRSSLLEDKIPAIGAYDTARSLARGSMHSTQWLRQAMAEAKLKALPWTEVEKEFLHHFESPALRDKLVRDLMTIKKQAKESVQEYSDRFTSLMNRTGREDDDEALVAVYIEGLDDRLQELMQVSRTSSLTTWMMLNGGGAPTVSIGSEISNAIALDASRKDKRDHKSGYDSSTRRDMEEQKKKCIHCGSRRHTTEQHRGKNLNKEATTKTSESKNEIPEKHSEKLKSERKCFNCGYKPWAPGHKCNYSNKTPNLTNANMNIQPNEDDSMDIRLEKYTDNLAETILGYGKNTIDLTQSDEYASEEAVNTMTTAPADAEQLM